MNITRKEFQAYLRVQHKGTFNMYSKEALEATQAIHQMTETKYKSIQNNYQDLNKAFIGTNINKVEITVYDQTSQPIKEPKEFAKELVDMYHKKYGYPSGLPKDSIPMDIKGITTLIEQARTYYTKQTE